MAKAAPSSHCLGWVLSPKKSRGAAAHATFAVAYSLDRHPYPPAVPFMRTMGHPSNAHCQTFEMVP